MSAIENRVEDFIFTSNGYSFKRTNWNGISVVQEVSSGYYSANNVCRENGKRFEKLSSKGYWKQYIKSLNVHLRCRPQTGPASLLESTIEILNVDNEFRGTYIHPFALNFLCVHVDYDYSIKVGELMNLLNERNQLTHQTLEQTIEKLNSEIEELAIAYNEQLKENDKLKAKNESKNYVLDELETELINRAQLIEEKDSLIDEFNRSFNQLSNTPMIYALDANDNEFQLRYDSNPNTKQGLRSVSLINAEHVRDEVLKILEKENLVIHRDRKRLISKSKLDYVFELIDKVKSNSINIEAEIDERNEFIDKQLARYRSMRQTSLVEGYIYEYETIRARPELTPWKLVPKAILNAKGENRKDKGIDAVEITNEGEFLSIVQIKHHHGDYLRKDELQTFFNKCSQERYKDVRKRLFVHNCKISDKLRNLIHSYNIEIEILN